MPKWMTAAFALFLSLQVFSTKGENVDDVINKYVKAMGGLDRLHSIKTCYAEGVIVDEKGNKFNIATQRVQDKLYRRRILTATGKDLSVISDSGTRLANPLYGSGFQAHTQQPMGNRRAELDCAGPLIDYISKGYVAELQGKVTIRGSDCSKILLILQPGVMVNYYIDVKTGFIIRETRQGFETAPGGNDHQGVTIDYTDYRKTTEGYIFPYREMYDDSSTVYYQKIEVNKP